MKGRPLYTHDIIKLIAVISMGIDHIGMFIWTEYEVLRYLGRLAAPFFMYLIGVQGSKKCSASLWIAALWMSGLLSLLVHQLQLSILISIILVRVGFGFFPFKQCSSYGLLGTFCTLVLLSPWMDVWFDYGSTAFIFSICGRLKCVDNQHTNQFIFMSVLYGFTVEYFVFMPYGFLLNFLLVMIYFILLLILLNYQRRTIEYDGWFKRVIMFCSSNSLAIYIVHSSILILWTLLD